MPARIVRVDDSLITVIRDVQRQFEEINKHPIKFTQASKALAMIYMGVDVTKPAARRSFDKTRFLFL